MIIGVVGSIAAGKGTVAAILEKKGFKTLVFSDILREELPKRGMEINRKNLQDLANELREKHGADYLARKLLEKTVQGQNYVLEGIRNPAEIIALRETGNAFIIGIDAPIEKRFAWIMMRGKERDPHSIEEVKAADARDNGLGEPEWGLQVTKSFKMADVVIVNDKTKDHLVKKIEVALKKLKIV